MRKSLMTVLTVANNCPDLSQMEDVQGQGTFSARKTGAVPRRVPDEGGCRSLYSQAIMRAELGISPSHEEGAATIAKLFLPLYQVGGRGIVTAGC